MNLVRLGWVVRLDLAANLRRPLFWILVLTLGLTAFGLSNGNVRVASGDATTGGKQAWLTSEFAVAMILTVVVFLLYSFFVAVAAGMAVIHDDELKVGELLHATSLKPAEYVWGKFLAVLLSFGVVLAVHLGCMMLFNHLPLDAKTAELRGPFALGNYLRPALVLSVPILTFLAGTSFAVGEWTRKPILVFVLPVALLLFSIFFLLTWSPTWLDPRIDQFLMLIDPTGFRWLDHTWLKVDRGADFYNHTSIHFDPAFLASRVAFFVVGLGAVAFSVGHLSATVRGGEPGRLRRVAGGLRRVKRPEPSATEPSPGVNSPLASLGMRSGQPGLVRGILEVARAELRELRSSPGLYLFIPLIILQIVGTNSVAVGVFQTRLLLTSGLLAVGSLNTLTLLVCLLMLFYTVESLLRERYTGLASIHYATPVRTASILFGKTLANSAVGVLVSLGALLGSALSLGIQRLFFEGQVGLELKPFLIVWGVLATITFLGWTAFVTAVLAMTGNRYTTYGICLGALIFTGYRQYTNQMNWVGNWDLWGVLRWSDMGLFELDRTALILNRVLVLGLAVLLTALAVRCFNRREPDAGRTLDRLRPWSLTKAGLRLSPYVVVPGAAGAALWLAVYQGFQGDAMKKAEKDYWKRNLATWKDTPLPALTAVEVDLELEPARRWFRVRGSYLLRNHRNEAIAEIPLTGGPHWGQPAWTMNGTEYEPDNRSRLYVFTPPRPLATGEELRIGFAYEGQFPQGITKNGGTTGEFILPAAAVLTSFSPALVPVLGYLEQVGVEDENRYDSKVYPDNFHEGVLDPLFGSPTPFTTKIRITGPADYTYNSVGTKVSDEVADGRRTVVWESDQPVRLFNVIAGRWAEKHGQDTVIYYHPGHAYNIDEMSLALDAARRYYSEWFYPYPWKELKLSEFPNLASYAQGFPTNITFSEGIGFLTRRTPKADAAFSITAHEAAHQWWGNLLTPGKGPGGNILSEGMAHFSTVLLCEQVKGPHSRIEFLNRIEESYGETRRKDSERPMVKTDGSRPGDQTVMYDKGGWVFWMLLNHMGREQALAGMRAFIEAYRLNRDHPVLQDFIRTMRPHAPDPAAYDSFVRQWFFEVVVPEYRLTEARREQVPAEGADTPETWEATVCVENAGTGRMPIDVAAVRGERFGEDGQASPDYQESRKPVILGAGESALVTIRCAFKPDRVLVDPDAKVFQLQRKLAVARF